MLTMLNQILLFGNRFLRPPNPRVRTGGPADPDDAPLVNDGWYGACQTLLQAQQSLVRSPQPVSNARSPSSVAAPLNPQRLQ